MVEYVEVRQGGADEINNESKEPVQRLSICPGFHIDETYQTIRYRLRPCLKTLSRDHWLMYAYLDGSRWKN